MRIVVANTKALVFKLCIMSNIILFVKAEIIIHNANSIMKTGVCISNMLVFYLNPYSYVK